MFDLFRTYFLRFQVHFKALRERYTLKLREYEFFSGVIGRYSDHLETIILYS